MPADPLYPAELGPEPRPEGQFRADLVHYLDALPVLELGSLLSELPRTRPGVLMVELNERLPDAGKLLRRSARQGHTRAGAGRCASGSPIVASHATSRRPGRPMWSTGTAGAQASRRGRWTPTTRARLQDAVRALGEEAAADRVELEHRAVADDDPGCPPDLFGPDQPGTAARRNDHDDRYAEPSLEEKLAADDVGGMTDRAAHAKEWRPADWIEPTYPDRDRLERDERDEH